MTGPSAGGRAGHEHDADYVDRDGAPSAPVEREGEYADRDVDPGAPSVAREGDYTDADVTEADTDTAPGGYTRRDDG